MVHVVFERPTRALKLFAPSLATMPTYEASGDAWGDGESGPYGHDYPIAPGHYKLTTIEPIQPPIASEGAWQIYVEDLDAATEAQLVAAGKASRANAVLTIGGIALPTGQLAAYGRSEIMIHGGGSNAPDPFAPEQPLCKTYGCTRMHNADLSMFVAFLKSYGNGNTLVFSVIGDPAPCSC